MVFHANPGTLRRAYLLRLMARHGTDVAAMARDRRLNLDQRTEGELRRGLRRSGLFSLGGKARMAFHDEIDRRS